MTDDAKAHIQREMKIRKLNEMVKKRMRDIDPKLKFMLIMYDDEHANLFGRNNDPDEPIFDIETEIPQMKKVLGATAAVLDDIARNADAITAHQSDVN